VSAAEREIRVESVISTATGRPFVDLTLGQETGRLTPNAARRLGTQLLNIAAGAEHDAATTWLLRELELTPPDIANFMLQVRAFRDDQGWNSTEHIDLTEPPA
jgi:hypothetical protein